MSYDWNTTAVAQWDQVQDPDVWQQHLDALQERATVWDTLGATTGTTTIGVSDSGDFTTPFAAGSQVQDFRWWSEYPSSAELSTGGNIYWGMQCAIARIVNSFHDPAIAIEGYTTKLSGVFAPICLTMAAARSAAALPTLAETCNPMDPTTPPNANSTWRRCRPREVYQQPIAGFDGFAQSDVTDIQGNAAAAGQVAFRCWLSDPVAGITDGATGLFTRDNSNTIWTYTPTQPGTGGAAPAPIVDLLDNTLAAPDTVTCGMSIEYPVFFTQYPDGFTNTAAQGDYLGHWLFDEVRAMTNQLAELPVAAGITPTYYCASASSTVSYADALSELASAWAPGSTGPDGTWVSASFDAPSNTWSVAGQRVSFTVSPVRAMPATGKTIDSYVYAQPVAGGTWDPQGDGLSNGSYHKIDSAAVTTATSHTTPPVGNAASPPPNAPPDPASSGTGLIGYVVTDQLCNLNFHVPGGFNYQF